jgi:hypothetical protein
LNEFGGEALPPFWFKKKKKDSEAHSFGWFQENATYNCLEWQVTDGNNVHLSFT